MTAPLMMSQVSAREPLASMVQAPVVMPAPVLTVVALAAAACGCAVAFAAVAVRGEALQGVPGIVALVASVSAAIWAAQTALVLRRSETSADSLVVQAPAPWPWAAGAALLLLPALVCVVQGQAGRLAVLGALEAFSVAELGLRSYRWTRRARYGLIPVGLTIAERRRFAAVSCEIGDSVEDPRRFDHIYVPAGVAQSRHWRRFLTRAMMRGVAISPASTLAEHLTGRIEIETVGQDRRAAIAASVARATAWSRWYRLADIVFSMIALIILAPTLALTALAIAVSMGRPFLFVQPRIGQGGRIFNMYKFRSMQINGEANVIATVSGDTRVTPLGRILRRSRLDELPQLWNILIGDMTLVGPRPEQPALVERYSQFIPNYDLRHLVKPGLTGWSQVCFGYAADVAETRGKLAYDLFYVDNRSLALDLQIILRTAVVLFDNRYVR